MGKQIKTVEQLDVSLWVYFDIRLRFRNKLVGGIPKTQELINGWVKSRFKDAEVVVDRPEADKHTVETTTPADIATDTQNEIDELKESSWVGFKSDEEQGLYVESRAMKAAFKECANILRQKLDVAALKAKVSERLFVIGERIYLDRMEPDGFDERPIHVMTAQGPRSALKRAEYVEGVEISFSVRMLDEPVVTVKEKDKIYPQALVPFLLTYMGQNGFGSDRSQGQGQFDIISCVERTVE